MKDFFENLGKIVADTTETVSKKTEVVVEIQKLKSQIRTMERANSRDYEDIGKIVFDQFHDGEVIDGECGELCEEIEKREEAIAELEKKVAEVRGMQQCANCGSHVEPGAVYCSNCGCKVDQGEQKEETKETEETTDRPTEDDVVQE